MDAALFHCRYGELEGLSAELYGLGTLGIQETELSGGLYELAAYFDSRFDAGAIPGFVGWREESPQQAGNWEEAWKEAWQPVAVGRRLWLAPDWILDPPPHGRLRIDVHPGQGSGTAYSEPTLLMLEALEETIHPGDVVADIGTGSGILLGAAKALGASRCLGCDVDTVAASEAKHSTGGDIWCGSPRSLASGSATLVAANLNAVTLGILAPDLKRIVRPGGKLLLGGFTERSLEQITNWFGETSTVYARGNWRVLSYSVTISYK